MRNTISLLILSALFLIQVGQGQIPRTMSYQGVLKDASGNLLNESVNLAFSLYSDSTGGTELWGPETYYSFEVTGGIFQVILGSSVPLDLDFDTQYWLQITVNGAPLSPRTPLTSSPYSLSAQNAVYADTAQYALSAPTDGASWSLTGNSGTTAGTNFLGTTDNTALQLHVNNARALRLEPNDISPNIIGGYSGNNLASGVWGATIGGGGASGAVNRIADHFGTVAGGYKNEAGADDGNTGNQWCATVGGGYINIASGSYATVPGGYLNEATAFYSFAAGQRAKANHNGTFVWADSTNADFASTATNQFLIRAAGGVGIGTANPAATLDVAGDVKISGTLTVGGNPVVGGAPIGSVVSYLKSFPNTPALPDGWVECNGQVLNDSQSPYNGHTIPNLNGENRFLRGNSTSGGTGGGEAHNHQWAKDRGLASSSVIQLSSGTNRTDGSYNSGGGVVAFTENIGDMDGDYWTAMVATPKPPYYEVVWIMRVK